MQRFLNRTWFHRMMDKVMPGNCRHNLEQAFLQNKAATAGLLSFITHNEKKIVAGLKQDRRIATVRKA